MSEKDLNIEYICEKTLLNKDDELVPIILDLIQDSYKAGLCQTEFDNTMNLIEENQELKKQLEDKEDYIKKLQATKDKLNKRDYENKTQQKEFIKFLEGKLLDARYYARDIAHYIEYVLRKYKEIVNGSERN